MSIHKIDFNIEVELVKIFSSELISNFHDRIQATSHLFQLIELLSEILPDKHEAKKYIVALNQNIDTYCPRDGWFDEKFEEENGVLEKEYLDFKDLNFSTMKNYAGYSWALIYLILHLCKYKSFTLESISNELKEIQSFDNYAKLLSKGVSTLVNYNYNPISEYIKMNSDYYYENYFGQINLFDVRCLVYGRYFYFKSMLLDVKKELLGKISIREKLLRDFYITQTSDSVNIYTEKYKKCFAEENATSREYIDTLFSDEISKDDKRTKGTKQNIRVLETVQSLLIAYPAAQKLVNSDIRIAENKYADKISK